MFIQHNARKQRGFFKIPNNSQKLKDFQLIIYSDLNDLIDYNYK